MRKLLALAFASVLAVFAACDDSSNAVKETPRADAGSSPSDAGTTPDGGDGGPSDCFTNPQTHFEIINACTNAVKITKTPTLPLLYPDGGLPPAQ